MRYALSRVYPDNSKNTVLYTGITVDLARRHYEHEHKLVDGFTKKYNVHKLVYAEEYADVNEAIHREKCIKRWKREWKVRLIEGINPQWRDLSLEDDQIPACAGMTV